MARLTITLSDERQRALKQAAAGSNKTIGQLIDDSLEAYGIKTERQAEELVAQARNRSQLAENQAMELAIDETARARRGA